MMAKSSKAFAEMKTPHLECRHLMHAWKHDFTTVEKGGTVAMHFSCMRSKCKRMDIRVRRTGELVSRTYKHPDGYTITDVPSWGGRRVFNSNVTVELIDRYTTKGGRKA